MHLVAELRVFILIPQDNNEKYSENLLCDLGALARDTKTLAAQ